MRHKATRIAFVCMGTVLRSGPRLAGDLLNPSVRNSFSISCALKGDWSRQAHPAGSRHDRRKRSYRPAHSGTRAATSTRPDGPRRVRDRLRRVGDRRECAREFVWSHEGHGIHRGGPQAVDLGVNFFDTADVYGWGHSEEVLGQALEGRREEVFLATKVGGDFYRGGVRMNFDPGYLAFALDRSLQRLRTDHVDLYQLHNPPAELMTDPTTYEVLDALKGEHKIDHYGVSVHEPAEALLCLEAGKPETLQIPFSLLRQEWIEEVLPQ